MKHFLLFAALGLSSLAISQTLYEEGFEGFSAGDYVSDSPVWITWTNGQEGSTGDAQISDEQAHSGIELRSYLRGDCCRRTNGCGLARWIR